MVVVVAMGWLLSTHWMYVYVAVVVVPKGGQWWVITRATCTVWWCFFGGDGFLVMVLYVCNVMVVVVAMGWLLSTHWHRFCTCTPATCSVVVFLVVVVVVDVCMLL